MHLLAWPVRDLSQYTDPFRSYWRASPEGIMPAKRKRTSDGASDSRSHHRCAASVISESAQPLHPNPSSSIKPSSYEKRGVDTLHSKLPADDWKLLKFQNHISSGVDRLSAVMQSVEFYSLLSERTEVSWKRAIALSKRVDYRIDTSRVYGEVEISNPVPPLHDKTLPFCEWLAVGQSLGGELIAEMFGVLVRTCGLSRSLSDLLVTAVIPQGTVWVSAHHMDAVLKYVDLKDRRSIRFDDGGRKTLWCVVTNRFLTCDDSDRAQYSTPDCAALRVINLLFPSDAQAYQPCNADVLSAMGSPDGMWTNPLRYCIEHNYVHVAASLLARVPAVELDIFWPSSLPRQDSSWSEGPISGPVEFQPTFSSAEDWKVLPNCAVENQCGASFIPRAINAARKFMAIYRRDRSALLRSFLANSLPFDMFDLIDAYGARPTK
jgi:hypothetical protein